MQIPKSLKKFWGRKHPKSAMRMTTFAQIKEIRPPLFDA